jgi:formyltetrahydrofolate-dependent phosphoribosylglycinamide formyltransferase
MFERLRKKWKVGPLQLALILCTFAIGGSLTGYAGRKLMNLLEIDQRWLWILIYIVLITILWPFAVLIVSIPFGQFKFFRGYLKKIGKRMGVISSKEPTPSRPVRIAIFASGAGSNAQRIIDYFRNSDTVQIATIACNKPGAGVLQIAARENIPVLMIDREKFFRGNGYVDELRNQQVDFIVLAGFLWKIPAALTKAYAGKIINIHPALLPAYGGKGMYGSFVHEAVISAGDKESGITIHYVDDKYDHGEVIFQTKCPVHPNDTADSLAERIHTLEHEHYPVVIAKLLKGLEPEA